MKPRPRLPELFVGTPDDAELVEELVVGLTVVTRLVLLEVAVLKMVGTELVVVDTARDDEVNSDDEDLNVLVAAIVVVTTVLGAAPILFGMIPTTSC